MNTDKGTSKRVSFISYVGSKITNHREKRYEQVPRKS